MIGPFSTTLVPLSSSSSSVDRQVLINVEASAISPDERKFGFIFTKIPFTRRSNEERKRSRSLDQSAHTFSLFAPPPKNVCTSRHCISASFFNIRPMPIFTFQSIIGRFRYQSDNIVHPYYKSLKTNHSHHRRVIFSLLNVHAARF